MRTIHAATTLTPAEGAPSDRMAAVRGFEKAAMELRNIEEVADPIAAGKWVTALFHTLVYMEVEVLPEVGGEAFGPLVEFHGELLQMISPVARLQWDLDWARPSGMTAH